MSQNATSRNRGLEKSTKTSHIDLNKQNMKQNQKSTNLSNSKVTSIGNNSDANISRIINHQSTQPVATQEQLRIAQLIGNRYDDPEINNKIKQVLDIVPNKNQDDVIMILHEHDYDVSKAIEYLLDGGDMIQEWTTIGKHIKKQTISPNQFFDDLNKNKKTSNRHNKLDNHLNGDRKGDKHNNHKFEKIDRNINHENENLEDKFFTMDLQDDQKNQSDQSENHTSNIKENSFRGSVRGGRGGLASRVNKGAGGERTTDRFERSNGRGGYNNNSFRGQPNRKERQLRNDEEVRTSSDEINPTAVLENLNHLEPNSENKNEIENSLRDIGTWSNEQAAPEPNSNKRRTNNSNQRQQQGANRFSNNKSNNEGMKQIDNEENEEEWQGDLTQTQIFTASNQIIEEASKSIDFPIGHFNTEEATQKIKNAIGIVTMNPKPATKLLETVNTKLEKSHASQPIKLGSVKPPPPSTKIPKSAVIMPGGNTNGFFLDFSFGVDMDTHSKKPEAEKETIGQSTVHQHTSTTVVPTVSQHVQAPLQQRQKEQLNSISQLNVYDTVKASTNENQQKIGVVNPVVINKNSTNKTDILNNLPLDKNSVSSVLTSFPKVELAHMNNSSSAQANYMNQNQPQQNKHQLDTKKSPQENNFINDSQKQQKQFIQFQQHNLNLQKGFNDQSSKVSQSTQQLPVSQSTTNNKQYINHLNQDVAAAVNLNINSTSNSQHNYQLSSMNQMNNSNQMKQSTSSQNISNTSQSSSSQLLNQISPQNSQKQVNLNSNSMNSSSVTGSSNKPINTNGTSNNNTMPPPPGVNMINPNSQFIMGLPFQQQFPYFDPSQMDTNNIMQMYNHLASVAPPGVGSVNEAKFNRSQDSTGSNSQLNPQLTQQQQPMNMIPGLSNFPFFFHNYYPNMFMSMPQNGGPQQQQAQQQQQNPQQFQNKLPYNFNSNSVGNSGNGVSDYETKDYNNYNPQSQMKTSGSNLNNVSDISGYPKNVDKSNAGYHTPPPNYPNSLNMNQPQPHPNVTNNSGAPLPPTQYAYMTSMIGTPGANPGNLVNAHGMQQDMNSRGLVNNGTNSIKQVKSSNYQNSPWS